jgi:hypothetical protein
VQNVIEMEDGRSRLKLTTATYRRPSGKNIHRFPDSKDTDTWGVMPDTGFGLRLSDREEALLLADRQERDVLRPHPAAQGHVTGPSNPSPGKATTMAPSVPARGAAQTVTAPPMPVPAPAAAPVKVPIKAPPTTPAKAPAARPAGNGPATTRLPPVRAAAEPKAPFVDRQLQLAVKYLAEQFGRAK